MPATPIFWLDSFSDRLFGGNPAAVCLLSEWPSDEYMQDLAAEINLSETAFVRPRDDGRFDLRWMTPAVEVDLCGHATLAAAHVLWNEQLASADSPISFQSRSGELLAAKQGELIEIDFPAVVAEQAEPPEGLLASLGVTAPQYVARNAFDWLVQLSSESEVRGLKPDFAELKKAPCRGVIVTALADSDGQSVGAGQFDFISRFFAPAAGVNEDPVTGSAHCCLAPHWSARLQRNALVGFQASSRGGVVQTEIRGDRVLLRGAAVMVLRGELC